MKIICLGDSFTEGFLVEDKVYTRFLSKAGFDIINLGRNGSTTEEMLRRFKAYNRVGSEADMLIVFGGTNDFIGGSSPQLVFKNLKSIVDLSDVRYKLVIVPPFVEEEEAYPIYEQINSKILAFKTLIKDWGITYIDGEEIPGHYLDGVHMASDFHENLAMKIIEKIGGKDGIDRKRDSR